jgi:DNA replication protein DnaC
MLVHPTIEKLESLRLAGMAVGLREQMQMDDIVQMSFEKRLGLLVDREAALRETRRLATRLRKAKLRQDACIEDVDFREQRNLDKSVIVRLAQCLWIKNHENLIISGPTGVGKSYLACALAQKACREGYTAVYLRTSRLFEDLGLAKGDGRYIKLFASFAKTDLLVLDDFGLVRLNQEQRHDLLERETVRDRRITHSLGGSAPWPGSPWAPGG